MASYQPTRFSIGESFDGFVTVCDDISRFYVHSADADLFLDEIASGVARARNPLAPAALEVGAPCVARFSQDGELYRAEIDGVTRQNGQCRVLFVDFGNTETKAYHELLAPTDPLLSIKAQAVACTLPDNIVGGNEPTFKELLQKLITDGSEVTVCVKGFTPHNIAIVDLRKDGKSLLAPMSANPMPTAYEHETLPCGTFTGVVVCNVTSPADFSVRLDKNVVCVTNMEVAINRRTHVKLSREEMRKGALCLAKFSHDTRVHRAEVASRPTSDMCKVLAVDSGIIELRNLDDLLAITPEDVTILKAQAIACMLSGFTDDRQYFSTATIDAFRRVTKSQVLRCRPVDILDGHIVVELLDSNGVSITQTVQTFAANQVEARPPAFPQYGLLPQVVTVDREKLPAGSRREVYVVDIQSPTELFLQFNERLADLTVQDEEMAKFYGELLEGQMDLFGDGQSKLGLFCAAEYPPKSGAYYRGRIVSVDAASGHAKIFYVDYGNSELVHTMDIKKLVVRFTTHPMFGVSAALAAPVPATGDALKRALLEQVVTAEFCEEIGIGEDFKVSVKLQATDPELRRLLEAGSGVSRPLRASAAPFEQPKATIGSSFGAVRSPPVTVVSVDPPRAPVAAVADGWNEEEPAAQTSSFKPTSYGGGGGFGGGGGGGFGSGGGGGFGSGGGFGGGGSSFGGSRDSNFVRKWFPNPRLNTNEEVVVAVVEGVSLYCLIHEKEFVGFDDTVQKAAAQGPLVPVADVNERNGSCLVYSDDLGKFARGKLNPPRENRDGAQRVRLIDLGTVVWIDFDKIYVCPQDLIARAGQCIECVIDGLNDREMLTREKRDDFRELFVGKRLVITPKGKAPKA